MCYFIVGNKIFCFFKTMSLCFFGRGYISREESSSQKFGGGGGGWGYCGLTDLAFFSWGGGRGEVKSGEVNVSGWD